MGPFSVLGGLNFLSLLLSLLFIYLLTYFFLRLLRNGGSSGEERSSKSCFPKARQDMLACTTKEAHFRHFQKKFPAKREQIKKCIRSLHEIADYINEVHKACNIAKISANSLGILGNILTAISPGLAPSSVSGNLRIAGTGLEAVGKVTEVAANLTDDIFQFIKTTDVKTLLGKCEANLKELMNSCENYFDSTLPSSSKGALERYSPLISDVGNSTVAFYKHIQGLQANPQLKDLALKVAAKELEMEEVKTMQEAGNLFAMTKEERLEKAISMIPILVARISSIVQASLFLQKGAKVEMAVTITEKAKQLEDTLEQLEKIYEYLKGRA